jgi:hypothetical protein
MKHNTLPIHPYLTDPRTGVPLQAVGIGKRGPIWPILGASEGAPEGGGNGGTGQDGGSGGSGGAGGGQGGGNGSGGSGSGDGSGSGGSGTDGDRGYPENTPLTDMTVEQREAYWKAMARKHEATAKSRGDYDAIKAERDKMKSDGMSDHEKQLEQARKDAEKAGRDAAARELGGKIVDAHINAAVTAGRMTKEQAETVLDGLDRTKFIDSKTGDVDTDKLGRYLDAVAPKKDGKGGGKPDHGQGNRGGKNDQTGKEAGLSEAQRRFGNRANSAAAKLRDEQAAKA